MPRPSRLLDRKLIQTAGAMLPETGVSGLKVREVARRAGVNVGMFHYHFKTKEAFVHRLLQETYEDFLGTFREAAEGPGAARARLRRVLVAAARFVREHRVLYSLMLRELFNTEPNMLAFAKENFPRHISVLMRLMEECVREGSVRPLPVPVLGMFAMSTMGLPNVAVTALERAGIKSIRGAPLSEFSKAILSDEMIETRADMVLAALKPPKEPRK